VFGCENWSEEEKVINLIIPELSSENSLAAELMAATV